MNDNIKKTDKTIKSLKDKALWVRKETLKIHGVAQETRLASSLSPVEIFVALFYGGIIKFDPRNPKWDGRDRFIISKGHGSISFYPILADIGYFDKRELSRVCKDGSFLGGIPDPAVSGYETVNGSLGHGLGVACGMALALKRKSKTEKVFVLMGDGELYEGAVWEAIMAAGEYKLDNLVLIIDNNKVCMLDFCKNIIDIEPLDEKLRIFKWAASTINGHDIKQVYESLIRLKYEENGVPKALIANTVKGKGIPGLEADPLSHIRSIRPCDIDSATKGLK